jgi:multiple sugar transport system permease protein
MSLWRRLTEPRSIDAMSPLGGVLVYAALIVWSLIVVFPIYWVAVTSLKLPIHVASGPVYLPFIDFEPSLHAWHYIFFDLGNDTLRPYVNSIIVALVSTALALLIGSMAAYALARIAFQPTLGSILAFVALGAAAIAAIAGYGVDWRLAALVALALFVLLGRAAGRRMGIRLTNSDVLFWIISQRILPPVVAALPIYVMFQHMGMLDTRAALIATYTTVNLPIVVWLMYDFFVTIPKDLEESASLDGASRFGIFFGIVLPLAKPGLVATGLLVLILAWNEYLLALFLSSANAQTMPVLVAAQNATRGPQWWYMSVLILLMILPVIFLTLLLQRFIAKGLLLGAVKG